MSATNIPESWLICRDNIEWRKWLNDNHLIESEVWLQIRKIKSKDTGVLLKEAVEEAICFGWIDGLMYSLDADKFIIRMTPRRRGSLWSMINRKRAEELIAAGRMTKAGMDAINEAKANGRWEAAYSSKVEPNHPDDLKKEADLLLAAIKEKQEFGTIVHNVESNPELIGVLLKIINEDKGSTKFYCDKVIQKISETNPSLVYPYFNEISLLLDSTNNFIKWGATHTISNLIAVDKDKKFDRIYDQYFGMINSDSMITASNVVGNAWKIVHAMPEKEADITSRLLKVTENTYLNKGELSSECKNIVIGNVIECFDKYYGASGNHDKMLGFARGQKWNNRKSTAKKALEFLKKHEISNKCLS